MKKLLKFLIIPLLTFLARAVVRRYRPRIVMVTGSVGKTSTKDALAAVLRTRYFVRSSEKSFNSELGVPFTVFGVENPWSNPFSWFFVLRSALALLLLPNHYPNMLVLEVGADRPGDLARILRIAKPDAVVVTRLPAISVHVEAYASPDSVREEEFSPAHALSASAPLIVCADDPYAVENALLTPALVSTFGFAEGATVRVREASFYEEDGVVQGTQVKVTWKGENGRCIVRGSVGKTQALPIAAALATAQAFGVSLADGLEALEGYEPPPGRGRLIAGRNGAILIDDTYNSSPAAVEEALDTLASFPRAKRRIAILGDMLELGRYSVTEHGRIGVMARSVADMVIAVGIRARAFSTGDGKTETMQFADAESAAREIVKLAREGDVILIKGSQAVRMEKIVEALLADPADASRLVRQERKWKQKV